MFLLGYAPFRESGRSASAEEVSSGSDAAPRLTSQEEKTLPGEAMATALEANGAVTSVPPFECRGGAFYLRDAETGAALATGAAVGDLGSETSGIAVQVEEPTEMGALHCIVAKSQVCVCSAFMGEYFKIDIPPAPASSPSSLALVSAKLPSPCELVLGFEGLNNNAGGGQSTVSLEVCRLKPGEAGGKWGRGVFLAAEEGWKFVKVEGTKVWLGPGGVAVAGETGLSVVPNPDPCSPFKVSVFTNLYEERRVRVEALSWWGTKHLVCACENDGRLWLAGWKAGRLGLGQDQLLRNESQPKRDYDVELGLKEVLDLRLSESADGERCCLLARGREGEAELYRGQMVGFLSDRGHKRNKMMFHRVFAGQVGALADCSDFFIGGASYAYDCMGGKGFGDLREDATLATVVVIKTSGGATSVVFKTDAGGNCFSEAFEVVPSQGPISSNLSSCRFSSSSPAATSARNCNRITCRYLAQRKPGWGPHGDLSTNVYNFHFSTGNVRTFNVPDGYDADVGSKSSAVQYEGNLGWDLGDEVEGLGGNWRGFCLGE